MKQETHIIKKMAKLEGVSNTRVISEITSNIQTVSPLHSYRAAVLHRLLPWSGALQNVVWSWNLAHLLLLATTTDTGGEDLTATGDQDTCKVETNLWFFTIFTNPAFYPHWSSDLNGTFFGRMEGGDSSLQCWFKIFWDNLIPLCWIDIKS